MIARTTTVATPAAPHTWGDLFRGRRRAAVPAAGSDATIATLGYDRSVRAARIAPESIILAAVCLLDLMTTLFWVAYRDAAEANPLMAFYLERHGVAGFVVAKFLLFLMPLVIAEYGRRHSPRFVRNALRCGIAAYLGLYLLGVARINGGIVGAARAAGIPVGISAEQLELEREMERISAESGFMER